MAGVNKCPVVRRELLSQPPRIGGLGIQIFSEVAVQILNKQTQERQYGRVPKIKDIKNKILV